MQIKALEHPLCELAECPLWNPREQALYWTDIPAGRIWRYDRETGEIAPVWEGRMQVGGIAFTGDDQLILCSNLGVFKLCRRTNALEPLFEVPMAEDERFNDITTDPRGRLFAGTLTERRRDGVVYRLEAGKTPKAVLRNLQTSNGMTFSVDLEHFYHTDSRTRRIMRYRYDADTGHIDAPELFYEGDPDLGVPDGLTIDAQDRLWVACFRGGGVLRLDPHGRVEHQIRLPARNISSLMFGGEDLDELYVTSGSTGAIDPCEGRDAEGRFLGGRVYRIRGLGVQGRREWAADF